MAYLDFPEIKEELVVFLRNADIFSIGTRGVATKTEELDGTGSKTAFTLTPGTGDVRNVRTVTVGGVTKTLGTDYTVAYNTGIVTFGTAPANGTDNVDITYDHGTGDKIFSDYPKDGLAISNYPRMALGIIGADSRELAQGGSTIATNVSFGVTVYDDNENDIEDYVKTMREAFLAAKNSFYTLTFITPTNMGPMLNHPEKKDKIASKTVDFYSPLNIEE